MSDTPRTEAEVNRQKCWSDDLITIDANFACQLERELNAANDRIKRLEDWKQSALAVEREWNANAIATMLGGKLGESQREVIQREVPKLLARIKRLEEAGDAVIELCLEHNPEFWVENMNTYIAWQEAKETNP